ncbi:MAG: hypothetical protein P1S46_05915, partial [bacterium]|nr:hypothetical protein [bacterium]
TQFEMAHQATSASIGIPGADTAKRKFSLDVFLDTPVLLWSMFSNLSGRINYGWLAMMCDMVGPLSLSLLSACKKRNRAEITLQIHIGIKSMTRAKVRSFMKNS